MCRRLLVSLLLALGALAGASDAPGSPVRLLELQDFTVEVRMKLVGSSNEVFLTENTIRESYSNSKRRALIQVEYAKAQPRLPSTFIYDRSYGSERLFSRDSAATYCNVSSRLELSQALFGQPAAHNSHLDTEGWFAAVPEQAEHIVGFSRLLVLLHERRLELASQEPPRSATLLRNHRVSRYSLQLDGFFGGQPVQAVMYYPAELSAEPSADSSAGLAPVRVWMRLEKERELILEYLMLEQLGGGQHQQETGPQFQADLFALPFGQGCAASLEAANPFAAGYKSTEFWPSELSFSYDLYEGYNRARLANRFVAYDAYSRTIRLDELEEDEQHYSATIFELATATKYNLRQPWRSRNGPSLASGELSCASAHIFNSARLANQFEPLIDFKQLSYMGDALVRGVAVVALEQASATLPGFLFSRHTFQDMSQRELAVYLDEAWSPLDRDTRHPKHQGGDQADQDNEAQDDDNDQDGFSSQQEPSEKAQFRLVYYFSTRQRAASSEPLPAYLAPSRLDKLLRVDVFGARGALYYRAEVRDWMWALTEAPNGDRRQELFSRGSECAAPGDSQRDQSNRFAELSMVLDFVEGSTGRSPVDAFALLSRLPAARNAATQRAIVLQTVASNSQIHQLQTKLRLTADLHGRGGGGRHLLMDVRARLSGYSYSAKFRAHQVGSWSFKWGRQASSSSSFEACFWRASHLAAGGNERLLMSHCRGLCFIDRRPETRLNAAGELQWLKSSAFDTFTDNQYQECRVLALHRVEVMHESSSYARRANWGQIYLDLGAGTMMVRLAGGELGAPAGELAWAKFQPQSVQVRDHRWSTTQGRSVQIDSGPDDHDDALRGLGLVAGPDVLPLKPSLLGDDSRLPASFNGCHAACMANISCNAFSYCVLGQNVECLLTGVEFRQPRLLESVRLERKKRPQRHRFWAQLAPEVEADDEPAANQTSAAVELRLEPRCQTYNKHALEMFGRATELKTRLNARWLLPVASEEQCARKCLRANQRFFARLAKTKLALLRAGFGHQRQYLEAMSAALESGQGSWCSSFKFLQLNNGRVSKKAREALGAKLNEAKALCQLMRPSWAARKAPAQAEDGQQTKPVALVPEGSAPAAATFDVYELTYSRLYERIHGVELQSLAAPGELPAAGGQQLVHEFAPDHNVQLAVAIADVEWCARACFSQSTGLRPWCRSFTFVEEELRPGEGARRKRAHCVFNSISLAEARRSPLADRLLAAGPRGGGRSVWHFEPQPAATLDGLVLAKLAAAAEPAPGPAPADCQAGRRALAGLVGACCGLLVGLAAGVRALRGPAPFDESAGRSWLVEPEDELPEWRRARLALRPLPELPELS